LQPAPLSMSSSPPVPTELVLPPCPPVLVPSVPLVVVACAPPVPGVSPPPHEARLIVSEPIETRQIASVELRMIA